MSKVGAALAWAFVKLRFVVVLAWIGGVVWVLIALPPIPTSATGSLTSLLPHGSPAIRAEQLSSRQFAVPLISRTVIVVRNPRGLPFARQAELVDLAKRLSAHQLPHFAAIRGALPLPDAIGVPPFARHPGTTVLLYLFFDPSTSTDARTSVAQRLVRAEIGPRQGEFEGVTGEAPAQTAEEGLIQTRLGWVELATILLVVSAVALRYRSVGAAGLTIAAVGAAYVVATRAVGELAHASGLTVPSQALPVLVVLVFGVTTDYSVFFLSRFRALLAGGIERRAAARRVVRETMPIVVTAGITVAAGTAALLVAKMGFVRGFGPALAIAVLAAMAVAVTLVPALLAIGGRWVFWPRGLRGAVPAVGPRGPVKEVDQPPRHRRWASARVASRHPVLATLLALAVVVAAGSGLRETAVANAMIHDLPSGSAVHRAYTAATRGFSPGVLAPVVVVVHGAGVGAHGPALDQLQSDLGHQPGVVQVLGPRQPPPISAGIRLWQTPSAARYVLFLGSDPLGARAIADVRALKQRLPGLLRSDGLTGTRAMVGGDTAVSADIIDATLGDLGRVVPTILVAIFVVMAIFLRALVAPVYLVLTSVLAAAAALGLTTYVMQQGVGYGQTTYYVIFTVVVLLISLGSDYNVFLVGRIWQEGRRRPLRAAVAEAGTRAARPISTAATVLALSFALLVVVPLQSFREIAFAMVAGLLIDAFVIRTILVPALLVLVGPRSAWPARRLSATPPGGPPAGPPAEPRDDLPSAA